MRYQLPHLRGLQIFEAVSRHKSMSRAGEELSISQSAVTQQIKRLEDFFGLRFVERSAQGISLTTDGERLARRLRQSFGDIRDAVTECLDEQRLTKVVSIAVLGTFAHRWLIPRLSGFQRAHPDIDVRLVTTSRMIDLQRDDVDISIRQGGPVWLGSRADFLMANEIFPVVSPRQGQATTPDTDTLAQSVWIQVDADPRRDDWPNWLRAVGRPDLQGAGVLGVSSSIHAVEAAIAGLGAAMGHTPFVNDALKAGHLVALQPSIKADDGDYYLVSTERRANLPKVRAFRDWVLAQI